MKSNKSQVNKIPPVKERMFERFYRADPSRTKEIEGQPELAKALVESGVIAIAYETVEVNRTLPLLTPMSEVAGRMASQVGAQFLDTD